MTSNHARKMSPNYLTGKVSKNEQENFNSQRTSIQSFLPSKLNSAVNKKFNNNNVNYTYKDIKKNIEKFMLGKRRLKFKDEQADKLLQEDLAKVGITLDHDLIVDGEIRRLEKKRKSSVSESYASSIKFITPRGLQAYDLAKNPLVEQRMKVTRYKQQPTPIEAESYVSEMDSRATASASKSMSCVAYTKRGLWQRGGQSTECFKFRSALKKFKDPTVFSLAMPWLKDRCDISSNQNRFGLPVNLQDLEKMTPMQYLLKYCYISIQSHSVYKRRFLKLINKQKSKVTYDELCHVIQSKLCNELDMKDIRHFLTMLGVVDSSVEFSYPEFSAILTTVERMLYVFFNRLLPPKNRSRVRSFVEMADMEGLERKLLPWTLDRGLLRLLYSLY